MVGQHFVFHPLKRLEESGNGGNGFFAVVKAGNYRCACQYGQIGKFFCQNAKIFEDTLVGQACLLLVHGAVHMLDIEQHVIEIWRGLADGIGRDHTAGFNRGLDAPGAGLAEQSHGKFTLQQGFAARKGQATARAGIESHILFYYIQHIIHCTLFAINQQTLSRAGSGAGQITRGATAAVYVQLVVITQGDGAVRTGHNTVSALGNAQAAPGIECQLRFAFLRFGVAAPAAGKGAALEKDNGSYAGAVMNRIFLYVKNHAPLLAVFQAHKPFLYEKSAAARMLRLPRG